MNPNVNSLTSDIETFKRELMNPNTEVKRETNYQKVLKSIVLSFPSDYSGCGHIRNIIPMSFLNSEFGQTRRFSLLQSYIPIFQPEILIRTRSIYFQRFMGTQQLEIAKKYKEMQSKMKYRMVWDLDDFIWSGSDEGEHIPEYNFGSEGIDEDTRKASVEIMNLMDTLCVSTEFLKDYIKNKLKVKPPCIVVPNSVPQYGLEKPRKPMITEKIKKPVILNTSSPTHFHQGKLQLGDFASGEWLEWIKKNITDNKIEYIQMGGCPYFLKELEGKENFKVIGWKNSYNYFTALRRLDTHFGIAPLVPNYFNYSKSDLKYVEYSAIQTVCLGTTFTNGKPSPYDNCVVKGINENITYKEIDELFDKYTEPEIYNETIDLQLKAIENRWMESPEYVNLMTRIF